MFCPDSYVKKYVKVISPFPSQPLDLVSCQRLVHFLVYRLGKSGITSRQGEHLNSEIHAPILDDYSLNKSEFHHLRFVNPYFMSKTLKIVIICLGIRDRGARRGDHVHSLRSKFSRHHLV